MTQRKHVSTVKRCLWGVCTCVFWWMLVSPIGAAPIGANTDGIIDTAHFTLPVAPLDTAKKSSPADTTKLINPSLRSLSVDSSRSTLTTLNANNTATEDTANTLGSSPYWMIGGAFALGGAPLFSLWQEGLADSLADFGLPDRIYQTNLLSGTTDTFDLQLISRENPNSYNVSFPLAFSYVLPTKDSSLLTFSMSAELLTKTSIKAISLDSNRSEINIRQTLTHGTMGIGIRYDIPLPPRYFMVSGVERTSVFIGIALHPLSYLRKFNEIKQDKSIDSLDNAIKSRVSQLLINKANSGFGLSWRLGVCSLKKYPGNRGLLTGISYRGSWQTFPRMSKTDINAKDVTSAREKASALMHQISIDLDLCLDPKKKSIP